MLLLFACGDPEPRQTQKAQSAIPAKPAIVFLGDSLSAGHNLPMAAAYPTLIQQKIDAAGLAYRVVNAGRSGDTTAGGLSRLSWYLTKEVNPAVFLIQLGSNDAMRGQDLANIEKNLRAIIQTVRDFNPAIKIFLFEMHTFSNLGEDYARDYAKLFPRIAREEKVQLMPFLLKDVAGIKELNQQDRIHPTAEGSKIVAKNVWQHLKNSL